MTTPKPRRVQNPHRAEAQAGARAIVGRARARAGVPYKTMGEVLHIGAANIQHMTAVEGRNYKNMSVADLLMLARAPETRELCRIVLAELQTIVDLHGLRVCDLVALAQRPETADLVRMILRPAVEALGPEQTLGAPPAQEPLEPDVSQSILPQLPLARASAH